MKTVTITKEYSTFDPVEKKLTEVVETKEVKEYHIDLRQDLEKRIDSDLHYLQENLK